MKKVSGSRAGGEGGIHVLRFLASCHFWISLFTISAVLFPVAVIIWALTSAFDPRKYILHQFTCRWSDIILGVNPYWKVKVMGLDKLDPAASYVMVANHQSGLDIIVLFKLHTHFKWVAKQELFSIPFIGWNMWLNGYIPIERSRGKSKLRMMDRAADAIRRGNSVMIFPEGTRSPDGCLQPYKTGAFRLALDTGSPVLPIAITGTSRAIRKGGLTVHRNRLMTLEVLDPLPAGYCKDLDARDLATQVHQRTARALNAHQDS